MSLFFLQAISIFFFSQRVLYYFIGKIFFRRTEAVTWKYSVNKVSYVSRKVHQKTPVLEPFLLEAVTWRCSVKKVSKASCKVHQKTPVLESFLSVKLQNRTCNFVKKELRYRCFLVKIGKKHFA